MVRYLWHRFVAWLDARVVDGVGVCWVCEAPCAGRAVVVEDGAVVAELYACSEHLPVLRDFMLAEHFGVHAYDEGESDE